MTNWKDLTTLWTFPILHTGKGEDIGSGGVALSGFMFATELFIGQAVEDCLFSQVAMYIYSLIFFHPLPLNVAFLPLINY